MVSPIRSPPEPAGEAQSPPPPPPPPPPSQHPAVNPSPLSPDNLFPTPPAPAPTPTTPPPPNRSGDSSPPLPSQTPAPPPPTTDPSPPLPRENQTTAQWPPLPPAPAPAPAPTSPSPPAPVSSEAKSEPDADEAAGESENMTLAHALTQTEEAIPPPPPAAAMAEPPAGSPQKESALTIAKLLSGEDPAATEGKPAADKVAPAVVTGSVAADSWGGGGVGSKRWLFGGVPEKVRRAEIRRAELGFRASAAVFCLVSLSVMAADTTPGTPGWSGDSFHRYNEYRYTLAASVVALTYSGFQLVAEVHHLVTGRRIIRGPWGNYFSLAMDQILPCGEGKGCKYYWHFGGNSRCWGREWTGEYLLDFKDLITSDKQEAASRSEEARFSFIKGCYVEDNCTQENELSETSLALAEVTEKALSIRNQSNDAVLYQGGAKSAIDYLKARSYRGLTGEYEGPAADSILIGRSGRAAGYYDEKTVNLQ